MKLTKEFKINRLMDYCVHTNLDIISNLRCGEFFIVIDLIMIGNSCSEEEAIRIYEIARKNISYENLVVKLFNEIFGKSKTDKETETVDTDDKTLEEIFMDFFNELHKFDDNLTFTEFLNMNTETMYRYAEGVNDRYWFNENKKYREYFADNAMFLGMFSGKTKECPQFNNDGTLHTKSLKEKLLAKRG